MIAGEKQTIIGILPPGFSIFPWDMGVDVWNAYESFRSPQLRWLPKMGRLKPGVTVAQAEAELNSIARGMEQHEDADKEWSIQVESLQDRIVSGYGGYFYLLQGAVGFVLLIACANVANLMLARGTVRRREIVIRAALGAGRSRLIRQLLTESVLLAAIGGVLGVLLGMCGVRVLISIAPVHWLSSISIHLDFRVLAFTLCISLLTAILFGLLPAFRASTLDLQESLKSSGGPSQGGAPQRGQSFLLVSEIALAIVLLIGAGLMISSFVRLHRLDLGFEPKNVLSADVFLDGPRFWHNTPGKPAGSMKSITPEADIFYRKLLERVAGMPGVLDAGISHLAPPGSVESRPFQIVGRPVDASGQPPTAGIDEVSAGYFRSLGISLRKGRFLSDHDDETAPWVVNINEALARKYFPGENPIGKLIRTSLSAGDGMSVEETRPREIVGVVGDVRQFGYGSDIRPTMYSSYRQHGADYPGGFYVFHTWKRITVRTAGRPAGLVAPLQKAVAEIDKDQALFEVHTMEEALSDRLGFPRFQMQLFGIFGTLALILAAVGIYGVMSYLVTQRTHEIGVRIALGARPSDVLGMVFRRGLLTAIIGLAAGIAASLALTRLIAGRLFGIESTDPVTYGIVAVTLLAVALLACYIPAGRAARVDPMIALRQD